jgi:hypothetical protein
MEGLTLGKIVYHVIAEGIHRPAIICHVENKEMGIVNLFTFCDIKNDSEGIKYTNDVYYSEEKLINIWHYIEKA